MTMFKTIGEWRQAEPAAYQAAVRLGIINTLHEKFGWARLRRNYWTKELCLEEALKYKSKVEWHTNSKCSVQAARRKGWYEECTAHMDPFYNSYTKEECLADAKKYNTKIEWRTNSRQLEKAAQRFGIFDECTAHMNALSKNWTKEECIVEAKKYENQRDWHKAKGGSFTTAYKYGWLEECTKHMSQLKFKSGHWTFENCKEEALKYTTRNEWQKKSVSSYKKAAENGWSEQLSAHMVELQKPRGFWTLEKCKAEALKYSSRSEWQKKHKHSYSPARQKGWLDECCKHMITPKKRDKRNTI